MRSLLLALVPLILTGVMVFSIVDIVVIDNSRVRHLPKPFWIILVILLSLIGSLLWFLLGREPLERRGHGRYRDVSRGGGRAVPLGPDDDPAYLERLRQDREREERIRDLERRLEDLDDDKPKE